MYIPNFIFAPDALSSIYGEETPSIFSQLEDSFGLDRKLVNISWFIQDLLASNSHAV